MITHSANPKGILVLRPEHQAGPLLDELTKHGFVPMPFATIDIQPYQSDVKIQLHDYQKIIFISRNAVDYFFRLPAISLPQNIQLIAIGKATAAALQSLGIQNVYDNPLGYDSEALLASDALTQVSNQSCLIVRGHGGRELLRESLLERGARVDYLEVYQRQLAIKDINDFSPLWQTGIAAIIATSNQTLDNLQQIIGETYFNLVQTVPLVVISDRMRQYAEQLGFNKIGLAASPANDEILRTLKDLLKQTNLV